MKKLFLFAAVICAAVFSSCEYDDTALRNDLDGLKDRVTALETTLNNEVAALKALINGKNCVTGVTEQDGGYKLTFSDGTSITISNGQDGADGTVIGVKEVDGVVYWTIDGEVTDYAVTGNDGATPEFKDGKWYINGEVVGTAQGDSIFKAVDVDEENNVVTFTLQDGSTFEVALVTDAKYENLNSLTFIPEYSDGKITVSYTSAADATVTVKYLVAPAAMADVIAANKAEAALVAVYTKTRAEAGATVKLPITSITAEESVITVVASAKDLSAEFFAGTQEASINFGVADALSSYMTDFIPAYANELFAASAAAQGYQGAKLTWNKYSKAATYKVSYEGFTSEAIDAAEYVFAEESLTAQNVYDFTVTAYDAAGNAVAEATAETEVYTLCNWTEPDFELQVQEDGSYKLIAHNLTNVNYAYGGMAATESGKSTIEIYKGEELQYTLVNSTPAGTLKAWAGYKRWALNAQDDRYEWTWTGINNSGSEVKTVPASWFTPGEYTIKYKIGYVVNKNGTWATSNNGFIPQAEKAGATHIYFSNGLNDVLCKDGNVVVKTQEGTSSEKFVIEAPVGLGLAAEIDNGTDYIRELFRDGWGVDWYNYGWYGKKSINGLFEAVKLTWTTPEGADKVVIAYGDKTVEVTDGSNSKVIEGLKTSPVEFTVTAYAGDKAMAVEQVSSDVYTLPETASGNFSAVYDATAQTWKIIGEDFNTTQYATWNCTFGIYEKGSDTPVVTGSKNGSNNTVAYLSYICRANGFVQTSKDTHVAFHVGDGNWDQGKAFTGLYGNTEYEVRFELSVWPYIYDPNGSETDGVKQWDLVKALMSTSKADFYGVKKLSGTCTFTTGDGPSKEPETPAIDWDYVCGAYASSEWSSPYWNKDAKQRYSKLGYGFWYNYVKLASECKDGDNPANPKDGQRYGLIYSWNNHIFFDIASTEINPETWEAQEGTGCYALINMIDRSKDTDHIENNYSYYNKNEEAFYITFTLTSGGQVYRHDGKMHGRGTVDMKEP